MNWSNNWATPAPAPVANNMAVAATPIDPMSRYDAMSRDQVLVAWEAAKKTVEEAKAAEMELRKYIAKRAFPQAHEGTNTLDLGNGYSLKAGIKFNYKLDSNLDKVEAALDRISKMGNEGAFLADRLVTWSADFKLTEYRPLCNDDATNIQKAIRKEIESILTITDAAPSLEIKPPKVKK